MTLYADNDAFTKLCKLSLLDEALAGIGVSRSDVLVLPTLRYRTKVSDPYKAQIDAALLTVSAVGAADDELAEELADVPGLHGGEAQLFAHAIKNPASRIATGDKVAIRAIPRLEHHAQTLAGRVICLEQLVRAAVNACDFAALLAKAVPHRGCDTAITAVFGSGVLATRSAVLEMLDLYITDLRRDTGTLLAP